MVPWFNNKITFWGWTTVCRLFLSENPNMDIHVDIRKSMRFNEGPYGYPSAIWNIRHGYWYGYSSTVRSSIYRELDMDSRAIMDAHVDIHEHHHTWILSLTLRPGWALDNDNIDVMKQTRGNKIKRFSKLDGGLIFWNHIFSRFVVGKYEYFML